ncbi:MAG: NAD(P)/FAD-dependent oxidoreductase [Lentisphaeria bacterium]|nr:NAD(P)/FAD-dependent oxidoreductase [Lentisphaeria bacterium]
MHYDIVIIGAGLSGMAAAIRLSHFGKKVAVLERHYRTGGLNSWYKKGGYLIDTGLHAMTNYALKDDRRAPLNRMLRQLRVPYDALDLTPQTQSSVRFSETYLSFTNSFEHMVEKIQALFPERLDAFLRLTETVKAFDAFAYDHTHLSARKVLTDIIGDGLLQDMLLCPLMYYGSAEEDDMDFRQFVLLFRSVFLEGFSRPRKGILSLLKLLEERMAAGGVDVMLSTGVKTIMCENGAVRGVTLDNGGIITCDGVLSSAGRLETRDMCDDNTGSVQPDGPCRKGAMSFVESVFILDRAPASLGFTDCVSFVSWTDQFHFHNPGTLIDPRSATVCVPSNFTDHDLADERRMIRVTSIADYAAWKRLSPAEYESAKQTTRDEQLAFLEKIGAGISGHVAFSDTFTPLTLNRFTSRYNGAIYGTPDKRHDGTTSVSGLYLCGTDQGFLGIVGALLSGVSMANYHFLG